MNDSIVAVQGDYEVFVSFGSDLISLKIFHRNIRAKTVANSILSQQAGALHLYLLYRQHL